MPKKFFFQISILRAGACCPDTREVFPGGFEASRRNFFQGCAALVSTSEAVFLGKDSSGPSLRGHCPQHFFFHIPISRVGTCCPDTREVFPGGFDWIWRDFSSGIDTPPEACLPAWLERRPFSWGEKAWSVGPV